MLFRFTNKFTIKKQNRNEHKNTHEDFYCNSKNLNKNVIRHVNQPKKVKKSTCFKQRPDSNFFTVPESRNSKHGIMHYDSEND